MWLTVSELVKYQSLPNTIRGCRKALDKLANKKPNMRRKRDGSKAFEYNSSELPIEIQQEIQDEFTQSIVKQCHKKNIVVTKKLELKELTTKQRDIADARMALVAYVSDLEQVQSRIKAIQFICNSAKTGDLSDDIMGLIEVANAKKNKSRVLSVRTLNQWVIDYHKCSCAEERLRLLAPAQRKKTRVEKLWWLPNFLAVYRQTNGVCVAEAYEEFKGRWELEHADEPTKLALLPSLSAVRRGLDKLPRHIKEIGRKTGAELRALNTYVKRDWSMLRANDVWVGDGHSMKMKVQHPDNGRPFIPEVTLIMDAPSRFIVGWSVSLAENCLAVADAIRNGVENFGIPAIYYSDNGGGEKNWTLDADITGIFPRLGINHQTGIPGNPQGRGIIERVNRSLLLKIARQFETYHGPGADRETVRKTSTAVISLEKAERLGRQVLTDKQKWAKGKMPSWREFIQAVEMGVNWYNNVHVHREIGTTPANKYRSLLQQTDVVWITPVEARDMFRPQVIRKAQRGWVSVFNNNYFNQELINFDGQEVAVSIDIHNADAVIIRDLDGSYICDGIFDGNKRDAFPETFVEKARKERAKRRMKLKQEQVDEIQAELNPIQAIEHDDGADLLHSMRMVNRWGDDEKEIAILPSELRKQKQLKQA